MKRIGFLLSMVFFLTTGFSQNVIFSIKTPYSHRVSSGLLHKVKTLSDINEGYPSSWIQDYISVGVSIRRNGQVFHETGLNDTLTEAQKKILLIAELNSVIFLDVKYLYKNPVSDTKEIKHMQLEIAVVPEIEAKYPGSADALKEYVLKHVIHKIPENEFDKKQTALARFIVNESGKITEVKMHKSSGNPKIDKLLLKAIQNMPKWRPAEQFNGTKVNQEFEFSVSNAGC